MQYYLVVNVNLSPAWRLACADVITHMNSLSRANLHYSYVKLYRIAFQEGPKGGMEM